MVQLAAGLLRRRRYGALAAAATLLLAAPASAAELSVASGVATVTVRDDPWTLVFTQRHGADLREQRGLGYRDGAGWHRAVRARSLLREGRAVRAVVDTQGGGPLAVRVAPAGPGVISVEVNAPAGAAATGEQFVAESGERLLGTGERSDAVDRRGRETESYVSDGPFREEDREYVRASTPPWAARDRDDSTYFPIPWILSTRGWGVLVDEDVTSRLGAAGEPRDRWGVDADGARLRLRVFAGPTPAAALGRFTAAVGRQPAPQAPWTFGPWFQTGQPNVVPVEEERAITKAQRDAGAPVSVAETQMHYLPCGAHKGREAAERERTDSFHHDGLARLVYFNPLLCVSYTDVFNRATAAGVLQKGPAGLPFVYPAFVGGSGPAGFTEEPLAQFDFTQPGHRGLLRRPRPRGGGGRRRRLDGGLRRVDAPGRGPARRVHRRRRAQPLPHRLPLRGQPDRRAASTVPSCASCARAGRARRAARRWSGAAIPPRCGDSTVSARPPPRP